MYEATFEGVQLKYDACTGILYRLKKAGWVAIGTKGCYGYLICTINGGSHLVHRLAWLLYYGVLPTFDVDHEDRIRHNNRITNLRDVPKAVNNKNSSMYSTNTSGVTGVRWNKLTSKWRAAIGVEGKEKSLGSFACLEEAISARKSAEIKYGFHVTHGKASKTI